MTYPRFWLLLIALFMGVLPATAQKKGLPPKVSEVVPALVRLDVVLEFASDGRLQKQAGTGSGVIIDTDGHIITNHHVAGRAIRVTARLQDGEEIPADLIGTDPLTDIAVVKLDLSKRTKDAPPLPVARFGDSDKLAVGDTVYAMGSPAAVTQSVTQGIVANTAMILPERYWFAKLKLEGEDVGRLVRWIGHDAIIFGGNSGGPLVDRNGLVIGINEVGLGSLGGAIPGNLANQIAEELIAKGEIERAWLGLELQPRMEREGKGVLIASTLPRSPAEDAEFKPGDHLVEIGGAKVDATMPEEMTDVHQTIALLPPNKSVTATVLRDGEKVQIEITPNRRSDARGEDRELSAWGITTRDFTERYAIEKGREDSEGVYLHSLRPGRFAADGDPPLRPGDVILSVDGQHVSDTESLEQLTNSLTANLAEEEGGTRNVLVGFERDGQELLSVVEIGAERPDEIRRSVRKSWLPIETQVLTPALAEALELEEAGGVRVTQVYEHPDGRESPLKVGDVLREIDGSEITAKRASDTGVFSTLVKARPADAPIKLGGLREGEAFEVSIDPELDPVPTSELPEFEDEILEFSARDLGRKELAELVDKEDKEAPASGVKVVAVESSGWAALGKLALGDLILKVDGKPASDVATLKTLLDDARDRDAERIVLFIRRKAQTKFLEIEPLWENEN